MATFFYFLGHLFSGQLFELFARETNLKKQSSVLPTALQYYILLFSAAIAFRAQVEKFCFFITQV